MRFLSGLLCGGLLTTGAGCDLKPRPADRAQEVPAAPPSRPNAVVAKPMERKDIVVLTPRAAAEVTRRTNGGMAPAILRVREKFGDITVAMESVVNQAADFEGASEGIMVVIDRESAGKIAAGTVVDFLNVGGLFEFRVYPPDAAPKSLTGPITLDVGRRGFKRRLTRIDRDGTAPAAPPAGVLQLVKYESSAGLLSAYVTPARKDDKKRPAMVWVTGGDCNSIDRGCWTAGADANEQSAAAFRKAEFVVMFPSLRGGNDNPGAKEGFYGEVDDVLAAAAYLRKQPGVDPDRVYLGGHSTGGTLALLVAECAHPFRAVFSFGPVDAVHQYGPEYTPFSADDPKELRLRSPALWMHAVHAPTFVFEGAVQGNVGPLRNMARQSKNPRLHFFEVKGASHFSVLGPTNRLIAEKLLKDTGPASNVEITPEEVNKAFGR